MKNKKLLSFLLWFAKISRVFTILASVFVHIAMMTSLLKPDLNMALK